MWKRLEFHEFHLLKVSTFLVYSVREKKYESPYEKEWKSNDESGIRTHAPEETRSLVWRLRPLGHLAFRSIAARWSNRDGGVMWRVGQGSFNNRNWSTNSRWYRQLAAARLENVYWGSDKSINASKDPRHAINQYQMCPRHKHSISK